MNFRTFLIVTALFTAALASALGLALRPAHAAEPPIYAGLVKGVAVGGYDPVAYFTDGKPVPGSRDITLEHEGAVWRFASAANRDAFKADPTRYAPQYGGYCAWAVSQNYTAKGDPDAWTISNGKLYLNYNKSVQSTWAKDIPGNVTKGDANWPTVLGKK